MSREIYKTVHMRIDIDEALYDLTPEERVDVATEMAEDVLSVAQLVSIAKDNGDAKDVLDEFTDDEILDYMQRERGYIMQRP